MLLTRILLFVLSVFACFGLAVGKGVSRDTNAEHSSALHFLYLHGEHVGLKTSFAVAGDITTYQTALVQQMGVLTDCLEWASEEGWVDADPGDIAGAIYARSMLNELSGNEYNWEVNGALEAFGDLSDADAEFLYNLDNVIRVEDIIPPSNLVGCNSFSEFGCSNLDLGIAVVFPIEDFTFLGDIKAVWEAVVICRGDPLSASCAAASAAAAVGLIVPGKLPVKAGTKAGDDITDAVDDALRTGGGSAPNSGFHSSGYRSEFYDASGNPTKWMNPLTGKFEDIPAGTTFHKDHVFPQAEIKNLPGFNELTPAQRTSLLNDPKNFQPLNGSMNCSKSCRVEGTPNDWPTYKGEPLNPQYHDWLRTQQQSMDQHFRGKIDEMLGG